MAENGAAVAAHDYEAEYLSLGILDNGDVGVGNVDVFAADMAGLSVGSSQRPDQCSVGEIVYMLRKVLLTAASILFFHRVGGVEGLSQKAPPAYLQSFGKRPWRLNIELAMNAVGSGSRPTFYSSESEGGIKATHLACLFVGLESCASDVLENHGRVSLIKFGLLGACYYCV